MNSDETNNSEYVGLDFEGTLFELSCYIDALIVKYGEKSFLKIEPDLDGGIGWLEVKNG
jgi:hypothetical protein